MNHLKLYSVLSGLIAGVLITVASMSVAQVTDKIYATDKILTGVIKHLSPIELVQSDVSELQKQVAELTTELKKIQTEVRSNHEWAVAVSKPPAGYTSSYITKLNFDQMEGTALMKFYVRY